MATQSMQALMAHAKAVAEARKNRPAESFWPNVKNWLVSREGNQPLPTCPVCYSELDVQGIDPVPTLDSTPSPASSPSPPSDPSSSSDHDHDHDQSTCDAEGMASVLPCGHIMCHNCILNTMEEMTDDVSALCPVCRTSYRGDDDDTCGHRVHYHVATAETKDDPNWIERIPLTIPEGGSIPDRCWACATYEHIYPEPLSEDEEFSSPNPDVFWDLLLLENESEFEGQTIVPSWRNVPTEVEGVDEADDTAESNAPGGDTTAPLPSLSPPSFSSGDDGDASIYPVLFEELRTARPLNGRVTPHHCCYYDSIFRDIHRWRSYGSLLPPPPTVTFSEGRNRELTPSERELDGFFRQLRDTFDDTPVETRPPAEELGPDPWDQEDEGESFEDRWLRYRLWRDELSRLGLLEPPALFIDDFDGDGDNEIDSEEELFEPVVGETRVPWIEPWRPVLNEYGPYREEREDGVNNNNRRPPYNRRPHRGWSI